ncbi:MAG: hypothetical protein BGN84_09915 [Afipia sp. 62-7]|nr:hypothetical protein [Afipia sp.]OJU20530.1 MAG: hypothetical protein BGN84_09915 [Afipia sp. 62-7]
MFIRKTLPSPLSRAVVLATAAALVLTVAVPPVAQASTATPAAKTVSAGTSDATDFSSARKRRPVRRNYRNNAAGAAFMGMALGTVGAIIAEQRRRDYYRDNYYYGGGPYYGGHYYGGPAYYGGGPYYPPY